MVRTPGEPFLPDTAVVLLTDTMVGDGMAELRWEMRDLLLSGVRSIVVDVSRGGDLSSTILATLLSTHRACRARGGGVTIRCPNRRALDLLRQTGLDRVFHLDTSKPCTHQQSDPAHTGTDRP